MERLAKVAHIYYEEDRTQGEIADMLHVSRPLVSRMLREARDLGIVEIRVHSPVNSKDALLSQLCSLYRLQGGVLVPEEKNDNLMNQNLAKRVVEHLDSVQPSSLGLGWGSCIGTLAELFERMPPHHTAVKTVCPLVGNSSVSSRKYHSDENVRIIAKALGAQPKFLHAPAFFADEAERNLLFETSRYRDISQLWDELDFAVLCIHNPSAADEVQYPHARDPRAAGHLVAYSYDINGQFLRPELNCIAHIPIQSLSRCKHVIGLCAADVSPRALIGALNTGILTHVFARESLVSAVLRSQG